MAPRILVVEDTADILMAISQALESENYEVASAMDVSVAEMLIANSPPDLAIIDHGLPDGAGSEICRKIRGQWDKPVIMFTGKATEDVVKECMESGACDYVLKGTGIDELLLRVGRHLVRTGVVAA